MFCYLALTLVRLLELKIFEDQIPAPQLFEFMRDYKVTDTNQGTFINNATSSRTFDLIKNKLALVKLGNLLLKKKDLDNFFSLEL